MDFDALLGFCCEGVAEVIGLSAADHGEGFEGD